MQRTILVRSLPEGAIQKERTSAAAIFPGTLVEYVGGTAIQPMTGADADDILRIVVESGDVAVGDAYLPNSLVSFIIPRRGDEVAARVVGGVGGTILAPGDLLVVDAAGGLVEKATAPVAGEAVAVALESVTVADGQAALVVVEVL